METLTDDGRGRKRAEKGGGGGLYVCRRNQQLEVQEPEAEDEADGWEIVDPAAAKVMKSPRSRASSWEVSLFWEKASLPADEVPEDLIMGCLDPECDAQFSDGCERHRCNSCKLFFCEKHLAAWPIANLKDDCISHHASHASSPRDIPSGLGMVVCRECRAAFEQVAQAPLHHSKEAVSTLTTQTEADHIEQVLRQPVLPGIDSVALGMEAQALRAMSLAEFKQVAEMETLNRTVARLLLHRSLANLRICLRPWSYHDREWVWRLRDELAEAEPGWIAQFTRQAHWENTEQAKGVTRLIERAHARKSLRAWDALEVLGILGRWAEPAVATIGERRLGLIATHAAEALTGLGEVELACCLELLLDAAGDLGAAGATGGRRAIVGMLLRVACRDSALAAALRGELFWALEARIKASKATRQLGSSAQTTDATGEQWASWASVALEELLRGLPAEKELGLLRQRDWVRHLERGEAAAARVEPAWGDVRAFPLAVWPSSRLCLGLEGQPREAPGVSAPVVIRCRCQNDAGGPAVKVKGAPASGGAPGGASTANPPRTETAGLLLKRDWGMHHEQQVGQTIRLLECLMWQDEELCQLLKREQLELEDVRVTYVIAMTGPGTAIVEAVDGARTLRDVRERCKTPPSLRGRLLAPTTRSSLFEFLQQHNTGRELHRALARLAFTAATSAVLSFVAGLGDRHHENFMVTASGRLLHVDYGYALGREPFDAVLIHYAVQGGCPTITLPHEELHDALGAELLKRVFWPVVRRAYLCVRRRTGLLAEMVYTATVRSSRRGLRGDLVAAQRAWDTAQAFVTRNCAIAMSEPCAQRFIHALVLHSARHERGAQFRDRQKNLCLREKTQQSIVQACSTALTKGRNASAVVGLASSEATAVARGAAGELLGGVRQLLLQSTASDAN